MDILHTQLNAIQRRLSFVTTDPICWKFYVQVSSWTVTLFESYLVLRQYPLYSKTEPPKALAPHFGSGVFEKSQKYGKDKAKFTLFCLLYSQLLNSAMLQYGSYAWCWSSAGLLVAKLGYGHEDEVNQSICFWLVLYFLSSIPTLPLLVYSTFVLEERHGFNKATPRLFADDLLKKWVLVITLGSQSLRCVLYTFKSAGDQFVPWLMAFLISCQLYMVILQTIITPRSNPLSPLPEGDLRSRIESLATKLRFPLKHLYKIDGSKRSSHSDAYFSGYLWRKHIVISDTFIQQSKPEEIEAVVAHELGHWFFLHNTKMVTISQIHVFIILALFPAFMHSPPLLRSFDFPTAVAANPPTIVALLLFQKILTPFEAVVSIGMNAIRRHHERQADRFACELQDKFKSPEMEDMGDRLGKALITLHVKNLSTVWVDWLFSAYYDSHPTLMERLKALEAYQAAREKKRE